jgi:Protein of unknown function (DUF3631)
VADLGGERWARAARVAAVTLVTASKKRKLSVGMRLLRDLKKVFDHAAVDKLPTDDVIEVLTKLDESLWAVIRQGEPVDSRGLSSRLNKYGIGPKLQRDGEKVFRGYARSQFADAWKRYLPAVSDDDDDPPADWDSPVTSVTSATDGHGVTAVTHVTDSTPAIPAVRGDLWTIQELRHMWISDRVNR